MIGERDASDRSYNVCFRPNKTELCDLYKEVEDARDFLWCIDMIYTSTLPAMNINSSSLAPHAADRAMEHQDRRKWATTKTEPPQKSERQQQSSSSRPQHGQRTAGGSYPQQGATRGRASADADDPNKIDNEIIDSIFRMNSGGDDDRWEIGDITSGYETYTSFEGGVTLGGAAVSVKFTINANTGYPIVQTVFGPCLIEGKDATFWECMDWPMRAVNAKGYTQTFHMMVNEQEWTSIEERSFYGSGEQVSSSSDTTNIISRLQQLERVICDRRRRDTDDSPMSVRIWMSLYDWMCMRGNEWHVAARPIIDSLSKAISDLVNVCKGMVIVCMNRDAAFHGGKGDLGTIANKVSEICKAASALVTENDRLWRITHALSGKSY